MISSDFHGTYEHLAPEDKQAVKTIITGSDHSAYPEMYDAGVNVPIYFNSGKKDLMDIVLHKAKIIKQTGVTKFFENQPEQVALLKLLCPNTKIILIGGKN